MQGGILLHLRGNVIGYMRASSKFKFLRFITGRHDIPFYYDQEVEVQRSFLNAFLKDEDDRGWSTGKVAPVNLCLRLGDPGYNNPAAELKAFPRREESAWPLPDTILRDYHLTSDKGLDTSKDDVACVLKYQAPEYVLDSLFFLVRKTEKQLLCVANGLTFSGAVSFSTKPFDQETEITGHPFARLSVSLEERNGLNPSEIDLFVTIRHLNVEGKEGMFQQSCL